MATGEVKITALPLDTTPTSDDFVVTVDSGTGSNKKVPLGDFSKALDYSSSLSTDSGNLIVLGTDDKIKQDANDIISTDASNTLSVGSDGKVYGSATALSLNEDELFVGNASNQPVSTPVSSVKQLLGLPTDYKNVSVVRDSGSQVTVSGKCRSEQDDIDLELSSSTPVTLLSPTANTRYNLFFAKVDSESPTVALFSTASAPAGYAHYRKVLTVPTDSLSSLANFEYNGAARTLEIELWSGTATSGTITLSDDFRNYFELYLIGFDTFFNSVQYGKWLASDANTYGYGTQIKAFSIGNNTCELQKDSQTQFTVFTSSNIRIDRIRGILHNV
jgi:hypothetical protein